MQIGLNSLISFSRPDRLFIEPTGLGHPAQVIETLTGEFYSDVLHLSTSVCLDAQPKAAAIVQVVHFGAGFRSFAVRFGQEFFFRHRCF